MSGSTKLAITADDIRSSESNSNLSSSSASLHRTATDSDSEGASNQSRGRILIPTVLCGGAGSRLWPVSRELHPKPFIRLTDGQSLLQKAFLRGAHLLGAAEVLTVTNRELFFKTDDEYREVNAAGLATSFILEPVGRNTAAAIAAATLQVAGTHGEDAIMLVLAADHLISDQFAFEEAVTTACALAEQGKLVTFGIQPDSPETGYGYIEASGQNVIQFVEKPSLQKAEQYLAAGNFYWNSGMFCFTAKTMLQAMEQHCPEILNATQSCITQSQTSKGPGLIQVKLDLDKFSAVPEDSIDYAIMEKSQNVAVVPCNIGWSDIGSWTALGDLTPSDAEGNRVEGEVSLHHTRNCTIHSKDRMVGVVGASNLVIIDTADALLVVDKSCTQNVKHIYSDLKARGHEAHKLHRTAHRPWGTYTVLEEGKGFKIKRIEVKPGSSLSLQMHHHRSEHWVVVSGQAKVVNGEREVLIKTNESTFIPAGHKHRLTNPGTETCVMIEVQSGEYLGEDDIVRFEDNYGRAN